MNRSDQHNQVKPVSAGTLNGAQNHNKDGQTKHGQHASKPTGDIEREAEAAQNGHTNRAGTPANTAQKNGPSGGQPAAERGAGEIKKAGSPSSAAEASSKEGKGTGQAVSPAKGGREADADSTTNDSKTAPMVAGAQPAVQAMDNESPAAGRSAKADKKSEHDQNKDGSKVLASGSNGVSEVPAVEEDSEDSTTAQNGQTTDKNNKHPKVQVPQHKQQQHAASGQGSANRK